MNAKALLAPLLCVALAAPLAAQRTSAEHWPERAVPRDIPLGPMIRRAYAAGTRDSTGAPGRQYWQQSVDYVIDANLEVETATLRGREHITLHNTSPDTLDAIVLRLYQNYFRAEESRNDYVTDITDGMKVERLVVNGAPVALGDQDAYSVDGTVATIHPASPVLPGATATLDVDWEFEVPDVPQGMRGERMGRWGHELYQVAQWYPQVAMYDDLRGWDTDQYLGKGEFYNQFGSFDVKITVPSGWLVGATGTLRNPEEVLSPTTRERLALAMRSDSTVHVVSAAERAPGQSTAAGQSLTWHFTAPRVNDFAFATSKNFVLDATHAMAPESTLVQVLYWPEHAAYARTAEYAKTALEYFGKTVMPYDFPQATVADGPETGMEYPMIIFSGPGVGVTTHELGHQWFPMMVGSNETWYGWQDEGLNEWIDAGAQTAREGRPADPMLVGAEYRKVAGSELEPPMMWPSDFAGPLYEEQAYAKAPLAMRALGGVAGDSAVTRAFAAYAQAWKYKHPSPWDFFMFMQRRLGTDLGWFWNAWWFTSGTVDQRVASVRERGGALELAVRDAGEMAMPVIARVELTDGSSVTVTRPASVWFGGTREVTITQPLHGRHVARVMLDPENRFQDVDRSNNGWAAASRAAR
ncbi:MAG TPA: M1 family metallopeptidase [Gemmatimonadaceae bacterium]|nr:M1 family metallopeptidase [Gemmatimonadaceae bacterium]